MIGIYEGDGHVYAEDICPKLDDLGARLKIGRFHLYTFRNPKSGTDGPPSAEQEAAHDELLHLDERAARTLAKDAERHADNIAAIIAERQAAKEPADKPKKTPKQRGRRVAPNGPATEAMETVQLPDGGEQ